MDEGVAIEFPWPQEDISNEHFVLRQTVPRDWIRDGKRRFPNEAHFKLRENEDGLSVNWDKYITVKDNYLLIGLTQNRPEKYIDQTSFKIFKFPVSYLRNLEGIKRVIHNPVFNGNPAPVGKPNNRAHSLVMYGDDEQIRMNLSDYCNEFYNNSYCDFEVNSVSEELEKLRQRLNDTPFHTV